MSSTAPIQPQPQPQPMQPRPRPAARPVPSTPPAWLPWLLLVLICCLQFGGYTISSVNFVAFVLAALMLGFGNLVSGLTRAAICAPFMFLSMLGFTGEPEAFQAFLRIGREVVGLGVILAVSFTGRVQRINPPVVDRMLKIGILVMFVYTGAQWVSLKILGEPHFFLHWDLYGMIGGNTHLGGDVGSVVPSYILNKWQEAGVLAKHIDELRPAAFYSEPSYLGMVLLALVFALTCNRPWRRDFVLPVGLALATAAVLSETASGVLALVVYLAVNFRAEVRRNLFAVILVAVPVAVFLLLGPTERLMGGIADEGEDVSGTVRLVTPFVLIGNAFALGHYVGVPFAFLSVLNPPTEYGIGSGADGIMGTDNGFLNLFINYGVAGLVPLAMLCSRFRGIELLFIILMAVSNGSFFAFDKAFLIAVAILYVRARAKRPAIA